MAHHSGPEEKALMGEFAKLFKNPETTSQIREFSKGLGATHDYPEGKLGEDDEGELRIGVTAAEGKVVFAFGKSIDWIGFTSDQARDIAQLLLDKACECDGIEARVWLMTT